MTTTNDLHAWRKDLQTLPKHYLDALEGREKWLAKARPPQIPPTDLDWFGWLILAGRGFGKTRSGAEETAWRAIMNANWRIGVIAPTRADLKRFCFEGESGLLSCIPPSWFRGGSQQSGYNRSDVEIYLRNGSKISGYPASEPERLRGPVHHFVWFDEAAAADADRAMDCWDNMELGLRLPPIPQVMVTTTPKPKPLVKKLLADPNFIISKGSSYDNRDNLPEPFFDRLKERFEGTRLGRQEIYADLLTDVEGALWAHSWFHHIDVLPAFKRIVVAVDPAASKTDTSDETGIVVAGLIDGSVNDNQKAGPGGTNVLPFQPKDRGETKKKTSSRACIIGDLSGRYSPNEWAERTIQAYHDAKADRIIVETNQGGDMAVNTLRTVDPMVPIRRVHASKGKRLRAEPIAALYEQGRVDHYSPPVDNQEDVDNLLTLEDQMTTWEPLESKGSPDRLDAAVYALTDLMGRAQREFFW